MNKIKNAVTREPVLTTAIVAGLIMAVSLGWLNLNSEQLGNIEGFLTVVEPLAAMAVPVVMAWIARQRVTPMNDPRTHSGNPGIIVERKDYQ